MKARLMIEARSGIVGWNQVSVLVGLRQVRPLVSVHSAKAMPQLDRVWVGRDHWGLWVLKSPVSSVGMVSSRV